MKYTIVLEEAEEGGYTATVPTLPGCISEGDTYEEALDNIKDAIALYLRAVSKEVKQLRRQRTLRTERVTIPQHPRKTLKLKTLQSILRQAHVSVEEFETLLHRK